MNRLVWLLLCLCVNSAMATQSKHDDKEKSEQPAATGLSAITVTATRTPTAVFTTPAAVTVIDRETLQQDIPYSFADILCDVPGVAMQGGPRRISEEPSIRGFMDEQVVIRVDGVRQNFNQAHHGRFFLDPDLLQRVEVLRGSGSAIYGSGAMGGVISLETVKPSTLLDGQDGAGLRLKSDWRSNGRSLGLYGTAYAMSDGVDVLASHAQDNLHEDLEDGDGTAIAATRDRQRDDLLQFGLAPAPHQRLELAASRYVNTGLNPPNADAEATATNVVDRNTAYDSYRLNYDWHDPANTRFDLHAVTYRSLARVHEYRLDDARTDDSRFTTTGLDVYNTSRFAAGSKTGIALTYGIEHYVDQQHGLRNRADRPEFPDARATYNAAWIQAMLPLGDRLSLIPGVRFDHFEYRDRSNQFEPRNAHKVSPHLSLGYQLRRNTYAWVGYSRAFRAPSLTELYASGVHFVAPLGPNQLVINEFVPTPGLKPETSNTLEAGLRWRHGDSSSGMLLSATAYRSLVDDYVDEYVVFISGAPHFDPLTNTLIFPGITSNRNVDARLQGFEGAAHWWHGHWFGALALTTIDGRNRTTDQPLASTPADKAVLRFGWRLPEKGLQAGSSVTFAAARDDVPENTLETAAYHTLDLFTGWTPLTGPLSGVEIRARIDNVFDKTYQIHPSGINSPGRSIKLSLAWTLGAH